ncbi:MAG: DUF4199 domain-containing protein [Porphyromonadaceae bacterium]|nr:DUF4199 domain-containing protein [Porphyromonadaceae bacterium]
MQNQHNRQPVVATATRSGLVLGLVFVLLFALWVGTVSFSPLIFIFLLGLPFVPLVSYRLARAYVLSLRGQGVEVRFMSIWSHTVMIFFFGTLVLLLPLYAYVRYMLPGVLEAMEQSMLDLFAQSPETKVGLERIYGRDPLSFITELRGVSVWTFLLSVVNMQVTIGAILGLINGFLLRRLGK